MRAVSQLHRWLAVALLACVARALAADATAPALTPVAHSALVTLEAARAPAGLTVRVQRPTGAAPLSVTELTASIDGKSVPVTPGADGSWLVAWPAAGAPSDGQLQVTVAHDGIREVLSGALPARDAGAAASGSVSGSMLHDHKQLAWWILNIAVVLVAVLAISRRMS
jgi:hypothetical protein